MQKKIEYYFPRVDWNKVNSSRFWCEDDPTLTHGLNAFSLIVPFAERHIIKTLTQVKPAITDAKLSAQLSEFLAEEARHSLQHTRFNQSLRNFGYPIDKINKKITNKFKKLTGKFSTTFQLALCVCLEHYTVSVAKAELNLNILKPGVCEIYDLFLWHSYEELAHKSCVYEIYQTLGGTKQILKLANLLGTWKIFFSLGFATYFRLLFYDIMHKNGITKSHLKKGYKFFFKQPALIAKVLDNYREIFKEDFAP